jgi:hypothetical protein
MTKQKNDKHTNKEINKAPRHKSLSGIELGQYIYCHRYPDSLLARGYIIDLHKTSEHEFASIVDEISGQYRITLLCDIIHSPTKRQISSANLKIVNNIKKVERDKEKKKLKKR